MPEIETKKTHTAKLGPEEFRAALAEYLGVRLPETADIDMRPRTVVDASGKPVWNAAPICVITWEDESL